MSQLHLRGVSDMLAAYLGEERLCTALYDEPGELRVLARSFAELYARVAARGRERRPPWRGGSVSVWGLYAPGPVLDYQMDAAGMLSAPTYREHFAWADERVLRDSPYSVLHLHAAGLHQAGIVAAMDGVRCVEVSLERETGRWDPQGVLGAARLLRDAGKPVLLHGELDDCELDWFLARLGGPGTAIFRWRPLPAPSEGGGHDG